MYNVKSHEDYLNLLNSFPFDQTKISSENKSHFEYKSFKNIAFLTIFLLFHDIKSLNA